MSVTPEGDLSLPLESGCLLLASSPTFQQLMQASSAALARQRCFIEDADDTDLNENEEGRYPRTILDYAVNQFEYARTATTGGTSTGPIHVGLEVELPEKYWKARQDGKWWWLNQVGNVWGEIKTRSQNGSDRGDGKSHLNVIGIDLVMVGKLDPTKINGKHVVGADFILSWRGM